MSDRLPCGCVIDTTDDAFVMEPCSPGCKYFRYAMDESKRQGKPIYPVFDPDVPAHLEDQVRAMLREHEGRQ